MREGNESVESIKYALVTGCDHGVGLALVKALADRGYHIAACRMNEEETQLDDLAAPVNCFLNSCEHL